MPKGINLLNLLLFIRQMKSSSDFSSRPVLHANQIHWSFNRDKRVIRCRAHYSRKSNYMSRQCVYCEQHAGIDPDNDNYWPGEPVARRALHCATFGVVRTDRNPFAFPIVLHHNVATRHCKCILTNDTCKIVLLWSYMSVSVLILD